MKKKELIVEINDLNESLRVLSEELDLIKSENLDLKSKLTELDNIINPCPPNYFKDIDGRCMPALF